MFKVNIVSGIKRETESVENVIDKIFVFYDSYQEKGKEKDQDLTLLFQRDPTNEIFSLVFDSKELETMQINKTPVIFLKQVIHIDDSIGVIKLKVFEALQKTISMDEIYMFCLKSEQLNPVTVYQKLTQNDQLPLTKKRLEQMILNLYDEEGTLINFSLPIKNEYTFDDILKLDLIERKYLVANVLGQRLVFNSEYPFIANPYLVTEYDSLLENSRREMSSLNNNLLLETGPIFKNTIFVCLAETVFDNATKSQISQDHTSKIYFPFLYKENIIANTKLESRRNQMIEVTASKVSERNVENVNMFYDIFKQKMPSTKFAENMAKTGIMFIKITIRNPETYENLHFPTLSNLN
jgi:hypothetical protein